MKLFNELKAASSRAAIMSNQRCFDRGDREEIKQAHSCKLSFYVDITYFPHFVTFASREARKQYSHFCTNTYIDGKYKIERLLQTKPLTKTSPELKQGCMMSSRWLLRSQRNQNQ